MNIFKNGIWMFFLLTVMLVGAVSDKQESIMIRNVNIIPMNKDTVLFRQDIVIHDGIIKQIKPTGMIKRTKGMREIDGSGRFLIPGLMDMHAHFFYEQGNNKNTSEAELKLMLANGLTTARIQCGDSVYLYARKMVAKNLWIGPQLYVSSPQIVGNWPWKGKVFAGVCTTPEEAVKVVRLYKQEGYDEIKITFMVKPDVYDAIIATAKELGIKVTGHVGPLVGLQKALAAGQQIEHMDEFIEKLLPDTSINHGMSVSDMGIWKKPNWETVDNLDETKLDLLADRVKKSGIYVTATNYFFVSCFGDGMTEEAIREKPDYAFIPSEIKKERWDIRERYLKRGFSEERRKKYVYLRNKMAWVLWKKGVKLMAGSDSPEWFLVQGFALHDELEQFVKAGLTPFAALQTATVHPAEYLGIIKNCGTIEEGKQANMVLLGANPLENIKHSRKIDAVIRNGEFLSRSKLDLLLTEAREILAQ